MRLILEMYSTYELRIKLVVTGGSEVDEAGRTTGKTKPVLERYTSKIGTESLIYNPKVYMLIDQQWQRDAPKGWRPRSALVPLNMMYRFGGILSAVYDSLSTPKLFREQDGRLYLDSTQALKAARKLTMFRSVLTVCPTVMAVRDGASVRGVTIQDGELVIGSVAHYELVGLIDLLERFDVTTYSLTVALLEQLDSMAQDIRYLCRSMGELKELLRNLRPATEQPSFTAPGDSHPAPKGGL